MGAARGAHVAHLGELPAGGAVRQTALAALPRHLLPHSAALAALCNLYHLVLVVPHIALLALPAALLTEPLSTLTAVGNRVIHVKTPHTLPLVHHYLFGVAIFQNESNS